ncbi:hypothetical protein TNCV_4427271 [Trichonephila clavipes]|nr:hypothetical protein TNCV_4427271 [Trichonephila clavipes]
MEVSQNELTTDLIVLHANAVRKATVIILNRISDDHDPEQLKERHGWTQHRYAVSSRFRHLISYASLTVSLTIPNKRSKRVIKRALERGRVIGTCCCALIDGQLNWFMDTMGDDVPNAIRIS